MNPSDPKLTRREAIFGACSALLVALLGGDQAKGAKRKKERRRHSPNKKPRSRGRAEPRAAKSQPVAGPISGESLFRDVISYYNIGDHRTATDADLKTSDWILRELSGAGLSTTYQRFTVKQFFPRETSLTIAGAAVRAFPLWPPRTTDPTPLRRALVSFSREAGPRSLNGAIALVRFPADPRAAISKGSVHAEIINAAARSGASAVVAVTQGPSGEIVALNVEPATNQWPVPVVLVGPRDEPMLNECAIGGREASLVLDGTVQEAVAKNVIGRLSRGEKMVVISTPQSGWFRCAAERGPGISLLLGLARWAARRNGGPSFLFLSTSGHELGALGMQAFQKELAPASERVLCWLHLGAGIASYTWEDLSNGPHRLREAESKRYLMSSPDLVPLLKETFADLPGLVPNTGRGVGEFELLERAGYRTFGIAAGHRFHHTPADSPEMTGPEILEPVASALVRTLEAIDAS